MRALSTLLVIGLMSSVPILARTATACPALAPTTLSQFLVWGEFAFAFDDEGEAPTPLYLDIISIAPSGTFQGTISTAPLSGNTSKAYYQVNGALTQAGPTGLAINFTYSTPFPLVTYTYSGAITLFAPCNPMIAGTYSSREVLIGPPRVISAGPVPFSGQIVVYRNLE